MKILAIRGENLASLHGPFEIDFEAEPLGRAGLFAITGPTGAGKSTLLDAICLALYGTTPRLESVGGRGHDVGREDDENRLTSTDPASLLRKGTASGSAEVIFRGRDGIRYRASWSVRRARNRADGKVQPPSVQLWNEETGIAIGRTGKEVYRAIEALVGLSYDQFCRLVLLAQGEFARFLLANEKERAELLERVTGTEIYRHISIAAHERHTEARQALAELQRELDGVQILSLQERGELEAEREKREAALLDARAFLQQAIDAIAWHEALASLVSTEGEAKAAAAGAESEWSQAAPLRETLAGVEQAFPLHPFIEAADKAFDHEKRAISTLEAAVLAADGAATAHGKASEAIAAARILHEAAVQRQNAMAPVLAEARRLDAGLEAARREAQRAAAARVEADARVAGQKTELESTRAAIAGEEQTHAAAMTWLEEHTSLAPLAVQWDRWRDQLHRIAGARDQEREAMDRASAFAEEAKGVEELLVAGTAAAAEALSALEAAEEEARNAGQLAAQVPRASLRERRESLDRAEQKTRELEGIAATASRLRAEALAFRREADSSALEADGLREKRTGLAAQRELLGTQLDDAERARQEARDALELTDQRALLREGEACPLCGSPEHPFVSGQIAIAERVREREERVASLRRDLAGIERAHADAEARAGAAERRHHDADKAASERTAKLPELQQHWERLRPSLLREIQPLRVFLQEALPSDSQVDGFDEAPADQTTDLNPIGAENTAPDTGEKLAALLQQITFARRALAMQEAEADRLEQEASQARSSAASLREGKEQKDREVRACEQRLQGLASNEREQQLRAEAARAESAALLQPLVPILDGLGSWRDSFELDLRGFAETLENDVGEWRRSDDARAQAADCLVLLRPRFEASASLLAERELLAATAAQAFLDADAALDELLRQRALVLDGEPASIHEISLREALAAAAVLLEGVRAEEHSIAAALTRAATLRETSEAMLAQAKTDHESTLCARDRALQETGLELEEARARLAHPQAEVDRWRQTLLELDQRRTRTKTLLEERQRARSSHESAGRPPLDEAAARIARDERKVPCEQAEVAFHDARNALRNDDDARLRGAAILPRLEARKAEAERWARLHELIGSASGDKFQLFAQSLTLEVLLAHANVHLEELAPRYRLERVPGHDLQLQVVDCNMGDDVRAATSLSGGETFLVSLALALGLSGLSSRTRVESLFIDEGFGSLDPQTLDIALATLDSLQASGRKVGVISHVQGMAERIGVQVLVQPEGSGRSRVSVAVR